jgi:hypothetical protein
MVDMLMMAELTFNYSKLSMLRHAGTFFMKVIFQIIFIIGTIHSFGQDREVVLKGDSLFVRDENMVTNTFNFGHDPLSHLNSIKSLKPTVEISIVANRHVDNLMDTIYTIKFGPDSFVVYKLSIGENVLLSADVRTSRFATKHGIKVGMTKFQVSSLLKDYNLRTLPGYLILANFEIVEYLRLEFNYDILKRIEFQGYFD